MAPLNDLKRSGFRFPQPNLFVAEKIFQNGKFFIGEIATNDWTPLDFVLNQPFKRLSWARRLHEMFERPRSIRDRWRRTSETVPSEELPMDGRFRHASQRMFQWRSPTVAPGPGFAMANFVVQSWVRLARHRGAYLKSWNLWCTKVSLMIMWYEFIL